MCVRKCTIGHLISVILFALAAGRSAAWAQSLNIPDNPGLRWAMPGEGYLKYKANPATGAFGEEWTGWLDIRHPSLAGANDTAFGYDRSDRSVSVRTTILTDNTGAVAPSDRVSDFDCVNRAYVQQAGLSLIETANRNVVSPAAGQPNSFQFGAPFTFAVERNIMAANNAGIPTFDTYYATSLASGAFAETYSPSIGGAPNNNGMFMANVNLNGTCDTYAHEAYHFLGDSQAVFMPAGGDPAHSSDPRNVVASGAIQWSPGMNQGALGVGNPPWNIPSTTTVIGPNFATQNGAANGAPAIGGFDQIVRTQASRIYDPNAGGNPNGAAPYIARGDNDLAGDRVDWDFVVDHGQINDLNGKTYGLEGLTNGADNHGNNLDSLYFEIPGGMPTQPSPQAGKNKAGLGNFPATPDYAAASFQYVDVFSMRLTYADSDYSGTNLSTREKALDYTLFCRAGDGSFIAGVPLYDFIGGWTPNTFDDDYLARWRCDNNAIGVFIYALSGPGHDASAQIDAVIVSNQIPEPTTLALLAFLGFAMARGRPAFARPRASVA